MRGGWVVRAMLKRATPAEASVVEPLALAAGFLWRCIDCKSVNDDDNSHCAKCHGARRRIP